MPALALLVFCTKFGAAENTESDKSAASSVPVLSRSNLFGRGTVELTLQQNGNKEKYNASGVATIKPDYRISGGNPRITGPGNAKVLPA